MGRHWCTGSDTGFPPLAGEPEPEGFTPGPGARLSVAIQRAGADGVINWRYAEYGNTLHDSNSDPVFAALNSAAINLAQCDRDLRVMMGAPPEGAGGVAAA